MRLYKVGGAVRDSFLNRKSKDIDYVVECESFDAMREEILRRGGKIYLESPKFFTIRGQLPGIGDADFVLARKEGQYKDGRHPEIVEVGTIYDDLARRDFTMNAIAIAESGEIIDPHGGITDIAFQRINCVGNAEDRFGEDGLRILRAIRFSITLGFGLSESIADIIMYGNMREYLGGVSQERIREELYKCFSHDTRRSIAVFSGPNWDFIWDFLWLKPTTER